MKMEKFLHCQNLKCIKLVKDQYAIQTGWKILSGMTM